MVPILGKSVCPGVYILVRSSLWVTCRSALLGLEGARVATLVGWLWRVDPDMGHDISDMLQSK